MRHEKEQKQATDKYTTPRIRVKCGEESYLITRRTIKGTTKFVKFDNSFLPTWNDKTDMKEDFQDSRREGIRMTDAEVALEMTEKHVIDERILVDLKDEVEHCYTRGPTRRSTRLNPII